MRLSSIGIHLFAGLAVYIAFTACSGGESGVRSGSGGGGSNDTIGFSSGPHGPGVAHADSGAGYDVVEVVCNQKDASGIYRAEHAFPGRSQAELAKIIPLLKYDTPALPGYDTAVYYAGSFGLPALYVRDGSVAIFCGIATKPEDDLKITSHKIKLLVPR